MTALPPFSPATFREVMRGPASSVVVVATGVGNARAGCTVTAICSLSDAPPALLVCLNARSAALASIRANGVFSANYLDDGQQAIADTFAGRTGRQGADRFDETWLPAASGVPLLRDAAASFECQLEEVHPFGSHEILIGRVLDASATLPARPLIYSQGRYGRVA